MERGSFIEVINHPAENVVPRRPRTPRPSRVSSPCPRQRTGRDVVLGRPQTMGRFGEGELATFAMGFETNLEPGGGGLALQRVRRFGVEFGFVLARC